MIIGIDIRMLASGNKTGVEEYTCQLLKSMLPLNSEIKFKLFYSGYNKQELNFDWINLPNVELIDFKFPNRVLDTSLRFLDFPKMENLMGKMDIFFSPHIFLTSNQKNCKKIATFHDLSFEKYPEFYSKSKNFWHFSMNPKRQAQKADRIIAVSNSTKQDLVEIYGIKPQKIKVIYSGLNPLFKKEVTEEKKKEVSQKYKLSEKYILYLGTLEPRKNISSLIKAFAKSKQNGFLRNTNTKLVIAGTKGWLYQTIFNTASELNLAEEIIFTGFIEEEDKPALYEMAQLFIYPSFYEGFGFPPLEAMARKTPVITSNISSIPEAVEDAALIINPCNIDEIKQAMESIISDKKLAQKLIERGLGKIDKFNWEKCGKETLDFIIN
jgi:glycosyltransferase involved in cell wall biosynthesis